MTILVCGDSFAAEMWRENPWCKYLEQYMKEKVENYAEAGTAIEFSYDRLLSNYKPGKYSSVIFLVTLPGRHFLKKGEKDNLSYHQSAKDSVVHNKEHSKSNTYWKRETTNNDFKIFQGLELANIEYPEWDKWKEKAITDSVKSIVKEKLLLLDVKTQMMKIQNIDIDSLGINYYFDLETKYRPNHMSIKQSKEFAYYVKEYLVNDFDIDKIFLKTEKYFTTSINRKEAGLK